VVHSEHNHAAGQTTHFLQIWLLPLRQGMEPGYEQKRFTNAEKTNILRLVASPDGAENSVQLNADARIYATLMDGSTALHQALDASARPMCLSFRARCPSMDKS
jgi:redox-sensitive bicupin YhaK (pirin superfamily)